MAGWFSLNSLKKYSQYARLIYKKNKIKIKFKINLNKNE